MSEQEKQEQNQPADNETGTTAEPQGNISPDNRSGQAKQEKSNSSGSDTEQTGEGTGAKAGEYS
jgi:hypothetical protein